MAWYATGTITVTNGSTTITGVGTAFIANVVNGYALIAPDGRTYEVASVDSNTQITLARAYNGATAAGQSYSIQPTQGPTVLAAQQLAALITTYAGIADNAGAGMFGDGSAATPGIRFVNDQDTGFYRIGANSMGWAGGGTLRVTFDTTGINNAAIGATTPSTGAFSSLTNSGSYRQGGAATGASPMHSVKAPAAHADWAANVEGGTTAGSSFGLRVLGGINSSDFSLLLRNAANTGTLLSVKGDATATVYGSILPGSDNSLALGGASNRFSVVYAGTSTINTSDAREKQQVGPIPEAWLDAWGDVEWQRFKFNEAVELKGEDARWHLGSMAQEVHAVFAAHGLDAFAIGLCCFDEWDAVEAVEEQFTPAVLDEDGEIVTPATRIEAVEAREAGDRWGLRYEECLVMEAAWSRRKLAVLEARIAALEP